MRTIPLPPSVAPELAKHIEKQSINGGLLFRGGRGARLTRSTFGDAWLRVTAKQWTTRYSLRTEDLKRAHNT